MEVEEDEVIRQDAEMQESEDESEDEDAAHGVVPAEMTLLQALDPALGEDDDYNRPQMPTNFSSFSITITEGLHNLTDGGELPLCRRTHLSASKGVTLAAYAQPRPRDSLVPTHGGGRLRYMADSTGSTMSGIVMTGINIQCVILTSSAVLFDQCELRTSHGYNDVSVLFIEKAGHATITSSILGGVTVEDQASQAVVVDGVGAEAVIVNSLLENCYGSTVIVCDNATARLSSCHMRDSYAALSVYDDTVSIGPHLIDARIELLNCTVQCVNDMWRDNCAARNFVEENTTFLEYEFKELAALDIDGRQDRVVEPKMRWDKDRNTWKHAGMTKHTRQRLSKYYEEYRINGTVDPRKMYHQVSNTEGRRSWESSEEIDSEKANDKLIDYDAWQDSSSNGGSVLSTPRKKQQGTHISVDTRYRSRESGKISLAHRYKSQHGHPGNPPVPKNKFSGGIEKARGARKGRHTYKHN